MDLVYIIGPCSLQCHDFYLDTAGQLVPIMNGRDWYYKASFDKANRSSIHGRRGPGLHESLYSFNEVKLEYPGIKLLTDVHEPWQVELLSPYIDCIQIPAFLCRQTDLLVECAKFFNKINIKKGQWMNPRNMIKGLDKLKTTNPNVKVWLCERGSTFGYEQLIVDFSSVDMFNEYFDRTVLDCTHSTQRALGDRASGGDPVLGKRYFKAAPIFGYTGLFAEVHPDPKTSFSDRRSQIHIKDFPSVLEEHDAVVKVLG